ncbi:MAG: glycosyltransferase, partial [Acidobacteriota bacterium]
MKLSIVIVTWQSVKVVGGCLRSLGSSGAGEILVVDNHSTDGTVSEVRRRFPETGILALPSNLGFAAACNRGLAATTGETVLFLNPDVRALPASVQTLLATLVHHPHAGAVGGNERNHGLGNFA